MLNKHCRYCPNCDILLAHQDELEHMLALTFEERAPEVIGNNYLVMGTFDKSTWRKREKEPLTMGTLLDHLHPFKEYLKIEYTPAHWGPADEEYPHISKLEAEKRREQGLSPPSKSTRRRRKRKKKS